MRLSRGRHPQEASFDLTPMIDVVLLLIIFFTMTSTFARTEQKMLDLPKQPGDARQAVASAATFVDVDREGRISILGDRKSLDDLVRAVKVDVGRTGGALDLVIRADKTAAAKHINAIAEALAAAGVRHWKLATAVDGPSPSGVAKVGTP